MGASKEGVKQGGYGCPELCQYILCSGPVRHVVRVRDVGDNPLYWEGVGRIPPKGRPQTEEEETSTREGRCVDIPHNGGSGGRGGTAGSAYLSLPPPEHSHIVHCDQTYYGHVSGGGADTTAMGVKKVVGIGLCGCVGDADARGGTVRGGERRTGQIRDRLSWWEYHVSNLGTEPNDHLVYALGLEHHHPIISTLGDPGRQLERERDEITFNQKVGRE